MNFPELTPRFESINKFKKRFKKYKVDGHSSVTQCKGGVGVYGSVQIRDTSVYGPTLLTLQGGGWV